jgi:hypothetical protein
VIDSDGKGYYMYLPSVFIKGDLASLTPDNRYVFQTGSGGVNKYFAGTAVAMLPFFTGGYLTALITHKPLSGYSPPFQRAISIAGLFYLVLGSFFLCRLLLLYNIRTEIACITILAIVFGTNLLVYAVYHPSFSHVYSFCFVALFLWAGKKFFLEQKFKDVLWLSFALGMIVLIRPTNGIIILTIPFLSGSFESLKKSAAVLFKPAVVLPLALFLGILSIQAVLWHIQTGHYFLHSYKNEGFYFNRPQILDTLFSFRKGFFLYTPLALLSLGGLVVIAKQSKFQAWSLVIFFSLLIYITASWWNWYYGPSFGQRPFIEFYPLNALLLAILISSAVKLKHQRVIYGIAGLLMVLNLVQSFQYVKNIISPFDMNYEKYKYTFLRTAPKYYSALGGCNDIIPYPGIKTTLRELKNDYEKNYPSWTESHTIALGGERKMAGNFTGREFNSACDIIADSMMASYRVLYAEIKVKKMELSPSGKNGPLIGIVLSDRKKKPYHYQAFVVNEIPNKAVNRWLDHKLYVEVPNVKREGDIIRIYIWNKHKQAFYIDDLEIRLSGIR